MTENPTPDPEDRELADDGTVRPADVDLPYKDDTSDGTTAPRLAATEPTDDSVPDGTQSPVGGDDEPNQDADAGVGGAEIEYDEDPHDESGE